MAYYDDDEQGTGERIREAAAEHPGATALVSLLTSPIALKAGSIALRWARRHPLVAIGIAAGAYVVWNRRQRDAGAPAGRSDRGAGGGMLVGASGGDDYDADGSAAGVTRPVQPSSRRSTPAHPR